MVKEIYIRTPEDPNFVPNVLEYSDEVEETISQLRVLLGTKNGEVLGTYNYGIDLDYLVFNTRQAADDIKEKIKEQILSYVHISPNLSVDVDVNFGQSGYGYDYAVIDISINGIKAIGFLVDKD